MNSTEMRVDEPSPGFDRSQSAMTRVEIAAPPLVMVLLKAPRVGAVKTRLASSLGAELAADIYRGMVERQLRQIPKGWRVQIHFCPADAETEMRLWLGSDYAYRPQLAGDLGERLQSAFSAAFAKGESRVMAIGGDCPELDTSTLTEATDRLVRADVVMGPATDGGYYLIALRRAAPELFKDIPWGTPEVLSLTLARAKIALLSRELLPPREDIDDLETYERYLGRVATSSSGESLAVIIPALNEAATVGSALRAARQSFPGSSLVVADGGSTDATRDLATAEGAQVITAPQGRGSQCRAGAAVTRNADWLLFLHADTTLPANAHALVTRFISEPRAQIATFRLSFDRGDLLLRAFAWFTRIDSVFTRFGDQGILIRREFYEALGGFPDWPLFEDVALLQRARAIAEIRSLRGCVVTSARRFQRRGSLAQQWVNARLLLRFLGGESPVKLAAHYYAEPARQIRSASTVAVSAEAVQ